MLPIIDRTSFNAHVNKPPTPIQEPLYNSQQLAKPNAEIYNELAAKIRAKKSEYSPNKIKEKIEEKPETIQEVAERIKQKRLKLKANMPLPVEKGLPQLKYVDKNGNECAASASNHALLQFEWRIKFIKPHLVFREHDDLFLSFAHHFNNSERISGNGYMRRNMRRKDAESPFVLGFDDAGAFIVKPDGIILTFELIGAFRRFNKAFQKSLDGEMF